MHAGTSQKSNARFKTPQHPTEGALWHTMKQQDKNGCNAIGMVKHIHTYEQIFPGHQRENRLIASDSHILQVKFIAMKQFYYIYPNSERENNSSNETTIRVAQFHNIRSTVRRFS